MSHLIERQTLLRLLLEELCDQILRFVAHILFGKTQAWRQEQKKGGLDERTETPGRCFLRHVRSYGPKHCVKKGADSASQSIMEAKKSKKKKVGWIRLQVPLLLSYCFLFCFFRQHTADGKEDMSYTHVHCLLYSAQKRRASVAKGSEPLVVRPCACGVFVDLMNTVRQRSRHLLLRKTPQKTNKPSTAAALVPPPSPQRCLRQSQVYHVVDRIFKSDFKFITTTMTT